MSRTFAGGTAGTDRIASLQATRYSTRSYGLWFNWTGSTLAFHRLFENTANRFYIETTTPTFRFECTWSTTIGAWDITAPSSNVWHFIGVSYDDGATTNNPIIWLDTTKNEVGSGITEVTSPAGTVTTSHTNLTIGNRSAANRAWAGSLAEFAQWSVILNDDEFTALAKGMSPWHVRPQSLVEAVPMLNDNISLKLGAPTVTGATVGVHPRIYYPKRRHFYFSAAAGGTTFPISADAIAVGTARLVRQGNLIKAVARVGLASLQRRGNLALPMDSARTANLQRQGNLILASQSVGIAALVSAVLVKIVSVTATAVGMARLVRQGFLNTPVSGPHGSDLQRQSNLAMSATAPHVASIGRLGSLVVNAIAAGATQLVRLGQLVMSTISSSIASVVVAAVTTGTSVITTVTASVVSTVEIVFLRGSRRPFGHAGLIMARHVRPKWTRRSLRRHG